MPDYSKGKIYMICSNDGDTEVVYYGSTCNKYLSSRMSKHRYEYIHPDATRYCSSQKVFDKYGLDNCHIELIKLVPSASKEELLQAEHEYIRYNQCINVSGKGRTLEAASRAKKKYKNKNKELVVCECGREISKNGLTYHLKTKYHLSRI